MAITALPTPPSRSAPSTFSTLADAFIAALPVFVTEANAQAAALDLNDTIDTSASSVAIGLGAKTFTVTAAKSFQPGMWLIIADDAAPSTNQMFGSITSYSGTTLVMNITSVLGSGTKTAWTISQSSPGGLTPGGPLDTPASGVLTNCTGLPLITGIVPGTANLKAFTNAAGTAPEWAVGIFAGEFTYDMSTTGAASVTGVGFKPAAGIFFAGIDNGWGPSVGWSLGAAHGCFYNSGASVITYGGYAWAIGNTSGGHIAYLSAIAMDADGFTYTKAVVGTPTGTGRVKFILFR